MIHLAVFLVSASVIVPAVSLPALGSSANATGYAVGSNLCGAAALVILSALVTSLALAEQRYEPSISVERDGREFVVNADGSYRQTFEVTLRIETPQAIVSDGTQRVAYPSSRETIESIEAWIIQPDGTKIIVPPESIRTQDEDTGEAVRSSRTQSTRSLYFHRYAWAVDSIGSLSHLFIRRCSRGSSSKTTHCRHSLEWSTGRSTLPFRLASRST